MLTTRKKSTSRAADHHPSRPLGFHFPRGYTLALYPTPAPSTTSPPRLGAGVRRIQPSSTFKLLAIRLRVFLKAQGASEAELDVAFDEGDDEEEHDKTMAAETDR